LSKPAKQRLDLLLLERGLAESRAQAQALILAGVVWNGDRRLDKPGVAIAADTPVIVKGKEHPWVSRGGVKLAFALDHFGIDCTGMTALDVGASTGGFTDVLLTRGATRVYAVDVGHNQIAWKLRQDARVMVMEGVNARHLTAEQIPEAPGIVTCDASFISLSLVLGPALDLAAPGAYLAALIKPQFEVGKDRVGKGGIVRDPELHREVCETIASWLGARPGWSVTGIVQSPITGAEGNVEFLIVGRKE